MNAFAALFADTKPMSAVEHRKSIEQNRLTYAIFARVIGVDARTARRFGDGSRKIPAVISGCAPPLTGVITPRQMGKQFELTRSIALSGHCLNAIGHFQRVSQSTRWRKSGVNGLSWLARVGITWNWGRISAIQLNRCLFLKKLR